MLRDAINEIRLHPGRFIATLLAIAISIGFMTAIVVGVRTEENATDHSNNIYSEKADVVVSGAYENDRSVTELISGAEGVTAVESVQIIQTVVSKDQKSDFYALYQVPEEESFRWSDVIEGSWPTAPDEITLAKGSAEKLGARIGDTVTASFGLGEDGGEADVRVVGLTNDRGATFGGIGYVKLPVEQEVGSIWLVRSDDPAATIDAVNTALERNGGLDPDLKVETADGFRAEVRKGLTAGFDVFRNLLLGFAGIALVVGMIIIANTFTILLTQRRRQIGLLRAVGASSGQVAGRLVAEALLLGLIGSLIGVGFGYLVALGVTLYTGSIVWGMALPVAELSIVVGVGVLATVLAVMGPSLKATRVSPLEALQVVPTATQSKRLSIARGVICVLLTLVASGLLFMAMQNSEQGLLWAIPGCGVLSLAVLLAAPFYVSFLIRVVGGLFSFTGPTTRLAVANSVRNPRRASATAVALMLAVGLIVTLQVGVSTMRSSALRAIDERYPVDISVRSRVEPLDSTLIAQLKDAGGVKQGVEVTTKTVEFTEGGYSEEILIRDVNPAQEQLGLSEKLAVSDGTIVVNKGLSATWSETVEVPGAGSLKVVGSENVDHGLAAVSHSTFEKITGTPEVREVWLKLVDRTSMSGLNEVTKLMDGHRDLQQGGSAVLAGVVQQVLNVLLIVLTGLLGIAVLIALVGVGNTLGLSVLERQRESALLRALGMQRASLRKMLLIEALLLGVVGVGVGILAGMFFSWVGVTTALKMIPGTIDAVFSVDLLYTGGLVLVCILAAGLASVLPGRRAANATPTEALAAD